MNLNTILRKYLLMRKADHLYRSRKVLESPQSVEPIIDGKKVLSFCSNDYLGLANHPNVIKSFKQAADKYGVGSGIYEDKLNHASLLDAALLSRAKRIRFPHLDLSNIEQRLIDSKADNKFIISDGVFSMDGDLASLDSLVNLAKENNATLMIDDAHGIGVLGEKGRGIIEHFGLDNKQIPVLVGTLGKAFGTAGAFVAGSETLIETLIQKSRSYIFTTAMPAAIAAATRKSLQLLEKENWRREKLQSLIHQFRKGAEELGLDLMDSMTAIQPIVIGSSEQTLTLSEKLLEKNILISAIRPPTVPEGTARLRITFSATHTEEHVDKLLTVLSEVI